jgi:hypothetical protein
MKTTPKHFTINGIIYPTKIYPEIPEEIAHKMVTPIIPFNLPKISKEKYPLLTTPQIIQGITYYIIPISPDYLLSTCGNHAISKRSGSSKFLQITTNGTYKYLTLFHNGIQVPYSIHQIQAIIHLGYLRNGNNIVVDHIDHNPSNNKLTNLQLISNRANCIKDTLGNGVSRKININPSGKKYYYHKSYIRTDTKPIQHQGSSKMIVKYKTHRDTLKLYAKEHHDFYVNSSNNPKIHTLEKHNIKAQIIYKQAEDYLRANNQYTLF